MACIQSSACAKFHLLRRVSDTSALSRVCLCWGGWSFCLGGVICQIKGQNYYLLVDLTDTSIGFCSRHSVLPSIIMELTAKNHSIPLSDGNSMPLIGLGTYGDPRQVRLSCSQAVDTFKICGWCFLEHSLLIEDIYSQTPKGTSCEAVKLAIEVGYRHIDGALVYFNEHEVGQAIREKITDGTVKREDIFYCGKACSFVIPTLNTHTHTQDKVYSSKNELCAPTPHRTKVHDYIDNLLPQFCNN